MYVAKHAVMLSHIEYPWSWSCEVVFRSCAGHVTVRKVHISTDLLCQHIQILAKGRFRDMQDCTTTIAVGLYLNSFFCVTFNL